MFKLITPDKSYQSQWEEIMSEWDDSDKRPRIFFQESYDIFLEKALQLSQGDNIEKSIPKSSLFSSSMRIKARRLFDSSGFATI